MTHPHREFNTIPLAYHITFRCYGTWLHGDSRGSVDRFLNRYGTPLIPPNSQWRKYNERSLKRAPVTLSARSRAAVREAIRESCNIRQWCLWAVRTNHVHTVVTANCAPDNILTALKANATRKMRERSCWHSAKTPWANGGSKKRLWTEAQLYEAIAYVEYEQGDLLDSEL